MKKQRGLIIKNLILIIAVVFASCSQKSDKFINETTGKEENIEIIRFDKELFAAPQGDLKTFFSNLQKKYPEVMAVDLNDARALKSAHCLPQILYRKILLPLPASSLYYTIRLIRC